jgi:Flp pilus assembly pilin Flp
MLSVLITWIRMHTGSERGQDLLEYALLGGLIALAIMAGVIALSGSISSMATGIGNCIDFDSTSTCDPF